MTGDLVCDLRVEKEKGLGESVGYVVTTLSFSSANMFLQVHCTLSSATLGL